MTERGPTFYLQIPAARSLLPDMGVSEGLTVPWCEGSRVQHELGTKMLVEGHVAVGCLVHGGNFRETLSVCLLAETVHMQMGSVGKESFWQVCSPGRRQEEGGRQGDGKSFDNNSLQCAEEDSSYLNGSCLAWSLFRQEVLGLQVLEMGEEPCGESYLLDGRGRKLGEFSLLTWKWLQQLRSELGLV